MIVNFNNNYQVYSHISKEGWLSVTENNNGLNSATSSGRILSLWIVLNTTEMQENC